MHKKTDVALLLSDKLVFKMKNVTRNKEVRLPDFTHTYMCV